MGRQKEVCLVLLLWMHKSGNMLVRDDSEQGQQAAPTEKTRPQELSCPSCGKQIGAEANFCQYCGAKANPKH